MSKRAELIRAAIDAAIDEARVALPGRVEAVDIEAQTVDVQPMILNRLIDDEGGVTQETLPVIPAVPISWPRGGGFFVTMPIETGDTGLIVFCDRSIDQWRAKGGSTPADPLDIRSHSLDGAVFVPGLHDSQNALADAHADNMVIGQDGGIQIHVKPGGEIHLGSENADQFVALAQKVLDELNLVKGDFDALKTWADAHLHAYIDTPTGPGITGPPSLPPPPGTPNPSPTPHTPAAVAAAKVKAD